MRSRLKAGLFVPALLGFACGLLLKPGWAQAGAGAGVLVLLALQDFGAVRCAGRWRFWAFPVLFFGLGPFFVGSPDAQILGRGYCLARAAAGLSFLLHAYVFTVLVAVVSRNASAEQVVSLAQRWGLRGFGLRLALALIAVKLNERMVVETFGHYRRQRPGTARFLRDLPVLAGAIMGNCARMAENISILFYIRGVRI